MDSLWLILLVMMWDCIGFFEEKPAWVLLLFGLNFQILSIKMIICSTSKMHFNFFQWDVLFTAVLTAYFLIFADTMDAVINK